MRAVTGFVLLLLSAGSLTGCYLGHVALGQARLLLAREPIEHVLRDPTLPAELRDRLRLVAEVRAFAESIGLDAGARYTSFARWPGDRVVTTVVATPPGSLEPVTHWFPIAGSVPYLGFFDPALAQREAERQRARGLDVCVSAVPAYSTLGWLDDPVAEPMLRHGDGWLVETLLHELLHRTIYRPGDAGFNEGLANFVGEEGSVAFFEARARRGGDPTAAADERARIDDGRLLAQRVEALRRDIAALYADPARDRSADARERARLDGKARAAIAALPFRRANAQTTAERARLGDACLALDAAYTADLPRWQHAALRAGGLAALVEATLACPETDLRVSDPCPAAPTAVQNPDRPSAFSPASHPRSMQRPAPDRPLAVR